MYIKKSLKSKPAPFPLAPKSPQEYLETITKVCPQWGAVLATRAIKASRTLRALWAAAVAVGNGCRISEVLGIRCSDLMPNGCAVIVGSKGSNARTIFTGLCMEQVIRVQSACTHWLLFGVSYREVWQAVVANRLAVQEPGHEHRSVTHTGRYDLAQKVAAEHGAEVAGQVLGHKSKNSVNYYIFPEACADERVLRTRIRYRLGKRTQGPQIPDFIKEAQNED